MKSNLENVSLCTDSSNGTVCHHDCKLNISFPPHTATKAIKRSSLPTGGRGGGRVGVFESSYSSSCSFTPQKCIIVMETISHYCSQSLMKGLLKAESRSNSLQLPLCKYTLRLTVIHQSVNAILYFSKFNFLSVSQAERVSKGTVSPEFHLNGKHKMQERQPGQCICFQHLTGFYY